MVCRLNGICNEQCNKHCELNAADVLVRFIRDITTIESRIGEFEDTSGKSAKLITSGMQIDNTNNPTDILTDISTPIDVTKKFKTLFNKTPLALLNQYIKVVNPPDADVLRDKFRKIESNRLLIMPIRPEMSCEVYIDNDKDTKSKGNFKKTTIEAIRWWNNPNTHTLECTIITEVIDGTTNKRGKISITDYGIKLRLVDVERSLNNSDIDRQVISMTRYGYIKPIAVLDKNDNGIIIDGTYMYLADKGSVNPIAYWKNKGFTGEDIYNEITKTAAYKKIKKSLNYIWQHRRFIAPYGFVDYNRIDI